ncbi:MAG TPA: hypothetical protein PKZ84_21750 [Anaerolineae bacterium]|nr:hypothetical protein [Anaerolineae bacterium]HQI87210.1 hypothetical protein [Anaerolineae bacterium]
MMVIQENLAHLPAVAVYGLLTLMVLVEGPVSILLAAGGTAAGFLQPLPVFCAVTLGNLIADGLWYGLGYYGPLEWLARRFKFLGVDAAQLTRLKRVVRAHAGRLLVFAKITNGLIVPVLIATGMARVSLRRWLPLILILNLLNSAIFMIIGYYTTLSLLQVQRGLEYLALAATLLFVLLASLYMRRQWSRRDWVAELETE